MASLSSVSGTPYGLPSPSKEKYLSAKINVSPEPMPCVSHQNCTDENRYMKHFENVPHPDKYDTHKKTTNITNIGIDVEIKEPSPTASWEY